MINTKCIKIDNNVLDNLQKDFKENLKIDNIQTYFPIMTLFFEFYNNSSSSFVFNSNFLVTNLIESINHQNLDSYIKYFFKAKILNQTNKETFEKDIFVKILPILNISQTMMDDYNVHHNSNLPNIHSSLTSKKINNYNNSAYIDSFFSYLGSNLTEQGKCPTFPLFFGTFTGIADEFKHDISEDYNSIKNTSWFKKNINNKFKIYNVDLDKSDNDIIFNETNVDEICQNINNIIDEQNTINADSKIIEIASDDQEIASDDQEIASNSEEIPSNSEEIASNSQEDNSKNIEINSDEDGDYFTIENISSFNYDNISINSDSNISLSSSDMYEVNYCCIEKYPVQINCIEKLEYTLDNYIDKTNNIPEMEWKSILFQICFGLAVAQKNYDLVHNDLHSSNIMFKETELEYLYYNFKGTCFKIPTFGKITKIIDFGRATFNYKNKVFFSDVFKKHGDAEGQYTYPYLNNLNNCKIKPNKSFDLSRLATTIIEHFDEDSNIYKLLKLWCMDKYGNF